MALSENVKASILSAMTGKSQYASIASTCYIGLLKDVSNGYIEPDLTAGYGRTLLGNYNNSAGQLMGSPTSGKITNSQIIYFPEATGDWGTVTHFGLFTSAFGGTPLLWGTLSEPVNIPEGYVPLFRVGKLSISID